MTTKEKMLVIGSLNASTKYYVRVLASTKVGRGNYSDSKGKITNGSKCPFFSLAISIFILSFCMSLYDQINPTYAASNTCFNQ